MNAGIRYQRDVYWAHQRTRQIAELLGFDRQQPPRLATAVSEIARKCLPVRQRGAGGVLRGRRHGAHISDKGPRIAKVDEILGGRYSAKTRMGWGSWGRG